MREFDVVVWGASGFTGRLVAEHLYRQYGVDGDLKWALAGRSLAKLERVRGELGAPGAPLVIADSNHRDTLDAMASRTTVVCSTVGPYALYGSALVAACVAAGTHYCDLSGEVAWMREMIDSHHHAAQTDGVCIVHSCGFDSIPSDLGVWALQQEMRERFGVAAASVKSRVRSVKGGFSGGTAATMINMLEAADRTPRLKALLANPYALDPPGAAGGLDGIDSHVPHRDADYGGWTAPFLMSAINTRVVRRSNALTGYAYGRDFRYDEALLFSPGPLGFSQALGVSAGSDFFNFLASIGAFRELLGRLLPKPGSGPSMADRESGFFVIEMLARAQAGGGNLRLVIRGDRDPGYGATAKMLGESAVCLAKDPALHQGGVLTPSIAMGESLLNRLAANAGMTFDLSVE